MRENGRITAGVVTKRETFSRKGGYIYTLDFSFTAFDPEQGRTRRFEDNDRVSCVQFNALRQGTRVRVAYDSKQPTDASLDLEWTFKPGMSNDDFNEWRSSKLQLYDGDCHPAL